MQTVGVSAALSCAHRLPGLDSHCRFLHGVTWHARVVVAMPMAVPAPIDVTTLTTSLGDVLGAIDHRLLVAADDPIAARLSADDAADTRGIVVIPGRAPTLENLARYVSALTEAQVAALARTPGLDCSIAVTMTEGDVTFEVRRDVRT